MCPATGIVRLSGRLQITLCRTRRISTVGRVKRYINTICYTKMVVLQWMLYLLTNKLCTIFIVQVLT